MTATANQPSAKLPAWAKLIKPRKLATSTMAKRQPLETREEEVYMRKRCYHVLSRHMESAMDQVLQEVMTPSVRLLRDYLDSAVVPSASLDSSSNPTSSCKRQRSSSPTPQENKIQSKQSVAPVILDGLDSQLFDQQQDTHSLQDHLLLPVVVLEGPSFGLDRKAQVKTLVNLLTISRPESAVIEVESQHRPSQHRRRGQATASSNWMMQALVQQCHAQVPVLSSESLHRRIIKRKKRKACTFSDMLLMWAQHSTSYKDIVVVLDADESFYSTELHDFLHILAARRSEQGIPLSVVFMAPHDGRRTMELRSTCQGYAGFMMRSITLPSPKVIVDNFWKQLYLKRKFPILLTTDAVTPIQRSFSSYQASFMKTLHKYQQALAYHFSQQGSLLTAMSDPSILSELWQRLAWFCVAREGNWCRSMLIENGEDISWQQIFQITNETTVRQQQGLFLLQLLEAISQTNPTGNETSVFKPSFSRLLDKATRLGMLTQLFHLRNKICNSNTESLQHSMRHKGLMAKYVKCLSPQQAANEEKYAAVQQFTEKQDFINELIILVGNCRDSENLSEIGQFLDETIEQWMKFESMSASRMKTPSSYWLAKNNWEEFAGSISTEPRQLIVAALAQAQQSMIQLVSKGKTPSVHLLLNNVAGTMYRLIRGRVAVTQEDWYEEFWGNAIAGVARDVSRDMSFILFSLGVRFLKQIGLISEKLCVGSRSDIVYERTKLVWCSGGA